MYHYNKRTISEEEALEGPIDELFLTKMRMPETRYGRLMDWFILHDEVIEQHPVLCLQALMKNINSLSAYMPQQREFAIMRVMQHPSIYDAITTSPAEVLDAGMFLTDKDMQKFFIKLVLEKIDVDRYQSVHSQAEKDPLIEFVEKEEFDVKRLLLNLLKDRPLLLAILKNRVSEYVHVTSKIMEQTPDQNLRRGIFNENARLIEKFASSIPSDDSSNPISEYDDLKAQNVSRLFYAMSNRGRFVRGNDQLRDPQEILNAFKGVAGDGWDVEIVEPERVHRKSRVWYRMFSEGQNGEKLRTIIGDNRSKVQRLDTRLSLVRPKI